MTKPFFVFLFISLLLSSCSSEVKEQEEIKIEDGISDVSEEKISYRDTTHTFSDIGEYYSFDKESDDTLISINGKEYRLHMDSKLDPEMRILHNQCYPDGDVLRCHSGVGYQGFYTFSLFEGETTVFNLKLTKEDLKNAEYELVLTSGAFLPSLIEYNNVFEAFVFQIPFNAEGTCWSSNALVVIGLDGNVQFVDRLSGSGGNSANYDVQISSDHSKLVSANAIHYPNGKSLSFINEDANLLGVDVFDDCLLVVYDSDKKEQQKNAYLKDYNGKTLLNFNYEGWTGALGYSFLRRKVKDASYFIDEGNKRLIQLKKVNDKWTYNNLPFSRMLEFDGNQRSTEEMVQFWTETAEFIFYVDATSGKIRKITPAE